MYYHKVLRIHDLYDPDLERIRERLVGGKIDLDEAWTLMREVERDRAEAWREREAEIRHEEKTGW